MATSAQVLDFVNLLNHDSAAAAALDDEHNKKQHRFELKWAATWAAVGAVVVAGFVLLVMQMESSIRPEPVPRGDVIRAGLMALGGGFAFIFGVLVVENFHAPLHADCWAIGLSVPLSLRPDLLAKLRKLQALHPELTLVPSDTRDLTIADYEHAWSLVRRAGKQQRKST